ncbi:MFS transporter [Thermostichus vulcanus]|uniref:MFS transporter n=1 Tax=Thermostichus vulcanus str. 'Rupite' TaxID=2813851 RepID=A0ABT0CEA1_THEVL|nr:MFS transporter [Thermostichus vulcanus]MCJ2544110.1 MFS transporter [Thermostichus vulcanus str. 'Rupite']
MLNIVTQKTEASKIGSSQSKSYPILPLLLIVGFVMTGMGVVSPVISLYGATFGVSTTLIGLLTSIFGIARLFVEFPAGTLSERWGRRPLLCLGPCILAISSFAAAQAGSFFSLLIWRAAQGVGSGLYMTGAMTSIADVSTPATRGRMMALYQGALLIGSSFGPMLGGFSAHLWGYTAPFWVFGVVASISAIIAISLFAETLHKHQASPGKHNRHRLSLDDLTVLFRSRDFLLVTFISFGTFFTRTAASWNLIPLVGNERFGMGTDGIGLSLTIMAIGNLFSLPVSGYVVDHYGRRAAIIPASFTVAFSLAMVAWAPSVALFLTAMALFGFSTGVGGPAAAAYVADVAPSGKYGPALGLFRTISDLGFVIGPLLVGSVVDTTNLGYTGGLLVNVVLVLISVICFAVWAKEPEQK